MTEHSARSSDPAGSRLVLGRRSTGSRTDGGREAPGASTRLHRPHHRRAPHAGSIAGWSESGPVAICAPFDQWQAWEPDPTLFTEIEYAASRAFGDRAGLRAPPVRDRSGLAPSDRGRHGRRRGSDAHGSSRSRHRRSGARSRPDFPCTTSSRSMSKVVSRRWRPCARPR
jgi:hypothetical protein